MNRHLKSLLSVLSFGLSGIFDKDMKNSYREYKNSGELSNVLSSLQGRYTGSNLTGAEIAANEFNAYEAEKARQFSSEEAEKARNFELEMANTAKQRQVQDYVAAGINPMFASGQSVSLPSASNAATLQAASVSPSSAAFNIPGLISSLSQLRVNKAQADALKSQSEQFKAAAANLRSESALKDSQKLGQDILNRINAATEDAQKEAHLLNNEIIRENIEKIRNEQRELAARAKKEAEEANSEIARQANLAASTALNYASVWEIKELLPYRKQLFTAQSQSEKYAAALSGINYIYQKGLITGGYLDSVIEKVAADAGISLSKAELQAINTALRTGDYSKVKTMDFFSQIFSSEGWIQFFTIFMDNFNPLNGLFGVFK